MSDEQHDDRRRYPRQQMVRAILVRPNGHKLDSHLLDLSLGGARPLPELFHATDIKFEFGPAIMQGLMQEVQVELSRLPQ